MQDKHEGASLFFAPNVSQEFKERFAEAVSFMNEHGTSYNIARIQASERIYFINEGESSSFNWGTQTIVWNPTKVAYNSESELLRSPATVLAHEFRHARDYDELLKEGKTPDEAQKILNTKNKQYDTEAERRAITMTEQYAARAHGEIGPDQVTRTNHRTDPSKKPIMPDFSNATLQQIITFIKSFNKGRLE